MSEYSGVVQKHLTKQWGNKTFHTITLSGVDGFFNLGVTRPPEIGTSVTFTAKTNARGYLEINPKTLQARTDGVPETASVVKATGKSSTEKGYWDRKEERDLRNDQQRELGASRNTAIALVDLMLRYEAIPMPKTQAKKEEFLYTLVEHYADKLMASSGPEHRLGKTANKNSSEDNKEVTQEVADPTTEDLAWS